MEQRHQAIDHAMRRGKRHHPRLPQRKASEIEDVRNTARGETIAERWVKPFLHHGSSPSRRRSRVALKDSSPVVGRDATRAQRAGASRCAGDP
jgi:hypothetical protein